MFIPNSPTRPYMELPDDQARSQLMLWVQDIWQPIARCLYATHAWAEVHLGADYIVLAVARLLESMLHVSGPCIGNANSNLYVRMWVTKC